MELFAEDSDSNLLGQDTVDAPATDGGASEDRGEGGARRVELGDCYTGVKKVVLLCVRFVARSETIPSYLPRS